MIKINEVEINTQIVYLFDIQNIINAIVFQNDVIIYARNIIVGINTHYNVKEMLSPKYLYFIIQKYITIFIWN